MAVTTSALASTGVPVPMVGSHPPRPLAWPRPAPCRPPTDDTDASAPGDGYADWEDGPCGVMTLTRGAPTPTNNDPTVQPALTAPGSRRLSRLPTAPYLSLSDKAPASGPVPSPLLLTPSSTTARSPLWASPPPSVFLTDAASPSPSSSSVQHQPVSLCTEPAAPQRRPPGSRLPPSPTPTSVATSAPSRTRKQLSALLSTLASADVE